MKNTGINRIPPVKHHILAITLNIAIIAVFYLFLGASISYLLRQVVPAYDTTWERWPRWKQILDVSIEMVLIVVSAFWVTYFARYVIPVIPVKASLEYLIEQFGGQVSFLYAIFVFLEVLDDKLIFIYKDIFA
jgi:hypothetical protein